MSCLDFIKFFIISLIFLALKLSDAASCEYRSRKFLTAVIAGQSSHEITRWLGRGADINYFGDLDLSDSEDSCGWHGTALHWAAKHNKKEIIGLLLIHGADKTICDSDDKPPFRYAQHKKLRKLLTVVLAPKDLTTGLGASSLRHVNRFGLKNMPQGWDMGDTSPSA